VERDPNATVGALSKLGSSRAKVPPGIFIQEISHPSILLDQTEECNTLSQSELDPMTRESLCIKYIKNEEEPNDKAAAERIAKQSAHYTLIGAHCTEEVRWESS
jgi:hypothetical protein